MTRQKKSRKVGQIGIRKQDVRPEKPSQDTRRKKSPKGQKSGNRNSLVDETQIKSNSSSTSNAKKDPKVGSKKAIELVPSKSAPLVNKSIQHSDKKPEVVLKTVKTSQLTPELELEQLENDEILIALAERVEDGELLKGKEAKYFNKHIARYDELVEQLGLEEVDDDENPDEIAQLKSDQWDDLLN